MALTGAQYQSMRTKFLGLLGSPYQGVSSAELDSFLGQLNIEVIGATAVTATQTNNANSLLAGYLTSPAYTATAANISEFFIAATAALPVIINALTGPRYSQLKQQLIGVLSYAGIRTEAQMFGYMSAFSFNGNFTSLFTLPTQGMQADRGLTYGSTPRATTGNTSATVMTLAGPTPATPVAVLVKATNTATVGSGATFNIYYDGGTTAAMIGVALNATPTPLTGAGAGLTLAASVASSVTNDTWNATAAASADQSASGFNFTQGSAALQPIVHPGSNGHVGLLFDGIDDFYACTGLNSFANMLVWVVAQQVAWSAFCAIVGSGDNVNKQAILQDGFTSTPNVVGYNGTALGSGPLPLATNGRIAATFNGASSSVKVGSNAVVNGDAGATAAGTGRGLGCDRYAATPVNFSKVIIFAAIHAPAQSYAAADAALNYWSGVAA